MDFFLRPLFAKEKLIVLFGHVGQTKKCLRSSACVCGKIMDPFELVQQKLLSVCVGLWQKNKTFVFFRNYILI